ncbi:MULTISPECIES: hypothetical protein [Lysinibacillus]|uniref:hypothetical protein n=1 Tax=Lysinibacillus TaxID=400634 RepID=UPI0004DA90ED|nr:MULTISPECIES: hypothetical protein [Lysinibacillus]AJK89661.1 hypothetical protein HR49_22190 [Lysinibacillus fusiformis]KHK54313.1 hypothetical protein PI85_05800 [Lysinibacillus sp. A1]
MHPYTLVLAAFELLQKENTELKRQMEIMKLQNISAAVATLIDEWLSKPYQDDNERQDIEAFSKEISKYIYSQLKA